MCQFRFRQSSLYLAGIILLALMLRIVFFQGISPGDPFTYSLTAWNIIQGHWNPAYFYEQTTRWGLLFPMALSYRFFGINDFSSTLWPMITSIGTVAVGYLLARDLKDEIAGIWAGLLLAFFPLEIFYASQSMADCPLGFWLLLSLYFFIRAEENQKSKLRRWFYILSGIALGLAYATKFVAILIAPFFLFVLLLKRRIEWNWIWFGAGFSSIFLIEIFLFHQITGDGLQRLFLILHDQASHTPMSAGNFQLQNESWRYLYWMFVDFHYVGIGFIILAGLSAYKLRNFRWQAEKPNEGIKLLFLWPITLFLILSVYPVSLRPYVPVYKIDAYMLMFSTPLLIGLAILLREFSNKIQFLFLGLIILCAIPLSYFRWESYRAHGDNARAIMAFYTGHRDRQIYLHRSDQRYLQYFDQFRHDDFYRSYRLPKPELDVHPSNEILFQNSYVAIDHYFIEYHSEDSYPPEIFNPPADWKVVYTSQRSRNYLSRLIIGACDILRKNGIVNLEIKEKAESSLEKWAPTKPVVIYAAD